MSWVWVKGFTHEMPGATLKVGRIISETAALRLREGGAGPGQQRVTRGPKGEP